MDTAATHSHDAAPASGPAAGPPAKAGGGGGMHGGHMMPATDDRRALVISGWLTGVYFLVELAIGWWTGSVAVTSDAFHTFSAVGGVLIAIVAGRFARRGATQFQTFGYVRAEIVGALFNGLFLALMAAVVLWMGGMRLMHPMELPTGPMLVAAGGGVATELVAMWLLYRHQKGNLNVQGAYWHILQTFVGSFIILVSALVIRFTGYYRIDPILGMAFGLVLFWASWRIIRESLRILLQGTPEGLDLNEVVDALAALPGVTEVHHVHAWSLTSGRNVFSAHLCVPEAGQAERARKEAGELLRRRFGMYFSTLQVEQECEDPEQEAAAIDFRRKD